MLRVRGKIDPLEPRQFMESYLSLSTSEQEFDRSESFRLKRLANFFEDLGVLECRRSLDIQWIEVAVRIRRNHVLEEMGTRSDRGTKIEEPRQSGDSLIWEDWETLAKKMEARGIRSAGRDPKPR